MRYKRILLMLIALVLLGGGGVFLLRGRKPSSREEKQVSLALTDLMVNLADRDRPHHLSVSMTLLITGADPEKALAECDAQIRDSILIEMSQHSYHELLSPRGKQVLKERISTAVGKGISEHKLRVEKVLFTAFLMD